jgi:hypothetical protein
MIAVLHVAFLRAVGFGNVKQLLTSLVPWYVSAREECYRYVMLMLARKKFWVKQFFITLTFTKFYCRTVQLFTGITIDQYPRQISQSFFYSYHVNVHWSRSGRESSSCICIWNSLSYSCFNRHLMNTPSAVQALEPHFSETATQLL